MKFKPYNYQKHSIDFIVDKPVAALFLAMGLGKTVITLSAIKKLKELGMVKRVLIIAPIRVAQSTWPTEIKKWDHLSDLSYSLVLGPKKKRNKALSEDTDIHIINRENVVWLINDSTGKLDYDMIVIDELSSFKDWSSKRFKALDLFRPHVKRIVGLTGTPSSNGLIDLYAQFKLLDRGQRLGRTLTQYRNKYFDPDKRSATVIFSYKLKEFAEELIYEKIKDITLSMKAEDYLDMPDLINNKIYVAMDKDERAIYDELKREMVVTIDHTEIDAVNAASLTGKLLQMANGSVYDEDKNIIDIHSKKLDALEDLIEAANGKPVLISYWFKHDKERILERFDAKEIKYDSDINAWNEGKIKIGLIQPQSVGMGINLQAGGSILIWYGLTWSLELYEQTNARLWRQGQKESVIIHHIITEDTIDEDVVTALINKADIQNALIDAVKAEVLR